MNNIAIHIPKMMQEKVLRKLLNTFPTEELDTLIDVIKVEQQRRLNEKK